MLIISITQINTILFFIQSYLLYCCSTNDLNLIFFNSIQNSHVHEPSKHIENLQHLHIATEKNLTSNYCLRGSLSTSVLCARAPGWRPFLLLSKMALSLGLPPKCGRPRRDKKNKAILLKETTFVIWNEVKTELGFKSKSNNEFAAFLLAKCGDDDKISDTSSECDAKRKKPAGKGERLF